VHSYPAEIVAALLSFAAAAPVAGTRAAAVMASVAAATAAIAVTRTARRFGCNRSDKNSVEGDGAGVVAITLNGNEATGSGTQYWASGAAKFTETFTLGAPAADRTIPYTGSGKCAGGTGVHKHEKCDFTFDGSLNPSTNVFTSNVTGTLTR
jgi:hypothetical protein